MANVLYPIGMKQMLLDKKHDLNNDTVKALLIDSADYTYSTLHTYLSDVPTIARVATSPPLASATIANGVFDTADFTWTAVPAPPIGDQSENIILYNHDGMGAATDATRMLIAFYDTGMAGMPVTPNGGDVNCLINAAGWFSL